jgi:hypothetical protein
MKVRSNYVLTREQKIILDGTKIITGARLNSDNIGTVAGATVVATEYGDGMHHITILTLTDFIIGAPGAGANLAIGAKFYSFPAGVHAHQISRWNLGLTQGGVTSDTPDMGLGSVVGAGAIAVLNGGTMEDYITGQTWAVALDGTLQATAPLGAKAGINTGISLNDTGDVKDVFLNAADGWNAGVTGNLTASGTIVLIWDTVT